MGIRKKSAARVGRNDHVNSPFYDDVMVRIATSDSSPIKMKEKLSALKEICKQSCFPRR